MSNCKTGECLAAWVDTESCICDVPTGIPMELSIERLGRADRLVREIKDYDRATERLGKRGGKGAVRTLIWYDDEYRTELHLPVDMALGIIKTMRFHKMVELQETGVVSTGRGHRPVISK